MERKALIDRIQGVFMIRRYTVALMQMDTQNDKGKNLETACAWIDEAAAKGAKLICFPEVMNLIGKNIGEGGGREEIPGVHDRALLRESEGTRRLYSRGQYTQALPGEKRSANTSVLISPEGKILATYSKLHMFDITLGGRHAVPGVGPGQTGRFDCDGGDGAGHFWNVDLL